MAALRRTALKVSPRMAPWMFTYLFAAFCIPDAPVDRSEPRAVAGRAEPAMR
jgi:hypothetical protein